MHKKHLAQNFLRDKNILRKEASLVYGKVLEIGGGEGALTKELVKVADNVTVVEIDERFKDVLERTGARVIIKDFLKIKPFKVDCIIGNIHYYISSKIIFRLVEWDFDRALLVVQKEFGEAMLAKPRDKKYTRLSVMSQANFNIKKIQYISSHLFFPRPKVDSIMIMMEKKDTKIDEGFVRKLFSHKNKTLSRIGKIYGLEFPKEFMMRRPRELSIDEIIILQNFQNKHR